jgi:hypothetical protein
LLRAATGVFHINCAGRRRARGAAPSRHGRCRRELRTLGRGGTHRHGTEARQQLALEQFDRASAVAVQARHQARREGVGVAVDELHRQQAAVAQLLVDQVRGQPAVAQAHGDRCCPAVF